MAAQSDLVAATEAAEVAVQELAAAYVAYTNAYKLAASEAYAAADAATASRDTSVLEQAIGCHRVAEFLRGRLIALGAAPVVMQAGAPVPADASWVSYLTNAIEHAVPAEAVAARAG